MGSLPPELSLDSTPTFVPKTISDFLDEMSSIGNFSERLSRLEEFSNRLKEELTKINAFKRELPLCMHLLNEAILTINNKAIECKKRTVELEFIPIKHRKCEKEDEKEESGDKMNWMSSAQLWTTDDHKNANSDTNQKQNSLSQSNKGAVEEKTVVVDDPFKSCKNKVEIGAFTPFQVCAMPPPKAKQREGLKMPGLSFLTPSEISFRANVGKSISSIAPCSPLNLPATPSQQQATGRKQRRCWSADLHRRFIDALEKLGGSQVATPKQIKELMKVDGLTNDEVKSHLQKYRLHTRRFSTAKEPKLRFGEMWPNEEQWINTPKKSNSQSGSPEGPLQLNGNARAVSNTVIDSSLDEEDDDDDDVRSDRRYI